MKKFEITVLQNAASGSISLTCNDPKSYLNQNKIVQVYYITDTSKYGQPSSNARQAIKSRTNGYLKQYTNSPDSCKEIENMINSLIRFDLNGCLTITRKLDKPLKHLVITTIEKLKLIQSELAKEELINNERYCLYLYFDPIKVTINFSSTKSERESLFLMHTYVCKSPDDKTILLAKLRSSLGSTKSIPINNSCLTVIQDQLKLYINESDTTTVYDLFHYIKGVGESIATESETEEG